MKICKAALDIDSNIYSLISSAGILDTLEYERPHHSMIGRKFVLARSALKTIEKHMLNLTNDISDLKINPEKRSQLIEKFNDTFDDIENLLEKSKY